MVGTRFILARKEVERLQSTELARSSMPVSTAVSLAWYFDVSPYSSASQVLPVSTSSHHVVAHGSASASASAHPAEMNASRAIR